VHSSRRASTPTAPGAARPGVLTTITGPGDEHWAANTELVEPPVRSLLAWLLLVRAQARGHRAFIGLGTIGFTDRYRDLLAAALIRRTVPGVRVVIADATFEPASRRLAARTGALGRVAAHLAPLGAPLLIRAVDGENVRWCVLSTAELTTFPAAWGVPPDRVRFSPFVASIDTATRDAPTRDDGFLFSGGDSLRDYDLLAAAAEGTGIPLRVAADWIPKRPDPHLTAGRVPHTEFMELLRSCRGLVLPLEVSSRSAGQQTYLNAMALAKPVIVTDAPGVRDYIVDGVTGVIVPADVPSLRTAMAHLMDPGNAAFYAAMGARARADVLERFTTTRYRRRLLDISETSDASSG
jgi:glycosyltransferase involved in cell wall biosynthesis